MKSIKKIYFIILGMILFGVLTVSASMMLQPDEVSFTSDKTSQNTVKGALDELYDISRGECPVGHICTTCGVGTYANQTTMECVTCPAGYTSESGAGKESDCYIQTTAGKYIANAGDSVQTNCPAGSYCLSTKIKYGSTGGDTICPSGYTSAAGATLESNCYIQTTAGKWLSTANGTTQTTCPAGSYCLSTRVNYGNTGGKSSCPGSYTSSSGATSISSCYITTQGGEYIASSGSSTKTTCPAGSYCTAGTIYYGSTGNITSCGSGKTSPAGSSNSNACQVTTYTYTKVGKNGFTGTYTCDKSTGIATITGCSYSGSEGSATCTGGYYYPTVQTTHTCRMNPYDYCTGSSYCSYDSLYNGCSTSLPNTRVLGGGLPDSESCS